MKIKTIRYRLDAAEKFDEEVNAALAEGWHLTKREVLDGCRLNESTYQHRMVYAELILPDTPVKPEPETIDTMKAFQVVKEECDSWNSCSKCSLHDLCNHCPPSLWNVPEEEEDEQ